MTDPETHEAIIPFQVDGLDVRGRLTQLGNVIDRILSRHAYPEPVSRLLGELIVLTALVGSSLKFDGRLIVQTQSDGLVPLMVVDFNAPGSLRAYARFDQHRCEALGDKPYDPALLMGKGALAMTIDQGDSSKRYQGIVAIDGTTLEEIACQYFRQSEQIPTSVRLAVAQFVSAKQPNPVWRAGGLLAQFLPHSSERITVADLPGGDEPENHERDYQVPEIAEDDRWTQARSLVETISDDELTDPQISSNTLLYRLFNETGVRIYDGIHVADNCSCSREKLFNVLQALSEDERTQALDDSEIAGKFATRCEFCSTSYTFTPDAIDGLNSEVAGDKLD